MEGEFEAVTVSGITPMLTVVSIEAAIDFYRDILGFRCETCTPAWACMSLDGVEIMFSLPNHHVPFTKPEMTGSLYLRTDDVQALWNRLKDACHVEYPLEEFENGMREFAIRDNS